MTGLGHYVSVNRMTNTRWEPWTCRACGGRVAALTWVQRWWCTEILEVICESCHCPTVYEIGEIRRDPNGLYYGGLQVKLP